VNCPSKGQKSVMAIAPASEVAKRNPVAAGRGVPLPPQRQMSKQSQRRAGANRGSGQAFTLTAEEVEASEEVVVGIILVHLVSVISLFDSGASHCYISTSFVTMHLYPVMIWTLHGRLVRGMRL